MCRYYKILTLKKNIVYFIIDDGINYFAKVCCVSQWHCYDSITLKTKIHFYDRMPLVIYIQIRGWFW